METVNISGMWSDSYLVLFFFFPFHDLLSSFINASLPIIYVFPSFQDREAAFLQNKLEIIWWYLLISLWHDQPKNGEGGGVFYWLFF